MKEWFNGNEHMERLYKDFVTVVHTWDDLIDKDKPVSDADINLAFSLALVSIPLNPAFQAYKNEIIPLVLTGIAGYMTANEYEKNKDQHGIELAHGLRYAIANVFSFLIVQQNGLEASIPILQEAYKEMIPERFDDYRKEHA